MQYFKPNFNFNKWPNKYYIEFCWITLLSLYFSKPLYIGPEIGYQRLRLRLSRSSAIPRHSTHRHPGDGSSPIRVGRSGNGTFTG